MGGALAAIDRSTNATIYLKQKHNGLQTSIDITDLIYEAYSKFGTMTNQEIDKLRVKHRLKVVQVTLHDTCAAYAYCVIYILVEILLPYCRKLNQN